MCQDVSGGKRPVLSHRRAATECDVERRRVRQCDAHRSIHQGFQNRWITAAFAWEILDGCNVVLAWRKVGEHVALRLHCRAR